MYVTQAWSVSAVYVTQVGSTSAVYVTHLGSTSAVYVTQVWSKTYVNRKGFASETKTPDLIQTDPHLIPCP